MIRKLKTRLKSLFFEGEVLRLMSLTFLTKPVGLVSQVLMAKFFGAGYEYDAYILSFFLVTFMPDLVGRVFAAVAIPQLAGLKQKVGGRDLTAYVNTLVGAGVFPVLLITVVLFFRGIWIVDVAAPNAPEETRQLAVRMIRMMVLPGVLAALVRIMKSVLNVNNAFRIPAVMPIVNSLTMLGVLVAFHERLGIWALPTAFATSWTVQSVAIIGYAGFRRFIAAVRPQARFEDLRNLWAKGWMVLVDATFLITNSFMDKIFASGLIAGSISAIAYANTLMNFGLQFFQNSLVTVMFTRMAELMARGDTAAWNAYLRENLNRLTRIAIPASLAVSVASVEVVIVLFQRDAFTADDTARTAAALSMYLVGLPAYLINLVVTRVYHTLGQLRDRTWLAFQFLATNVTGNLLLVGPLGVMGLAISSTIAINTHLALSVWMLTRYETGLEIAPMARRVLLHYVFGGLAWLAYEVAVRQRLDELGAEAGLWGAVGIGAARAASIFLAFFIMIMARRFVARRRR